MKIKFDKSGIADIPALKKLWLECFSEKPQAAALFFDKNYNGLSAYSAKYDGNTVAAVYLIHAQLNGGRAHYLCGAATLPRYRGRGIMSALIEYALKDAAQNGDKYSLLFPADGGLYSFYERLGYSEACTAAKAELTRDVLKRRNTDTGKNSIPAPIDYEQMQKKCFKNNFLLQNNNFMKFASEYYSLYGLKTVKGRGCFALIDERGDCADVFYSAFADFGELGTLLLESTGAQRFLFTGKSDGELFKNRKTEKYGMIKSLDDRYKIPGDVFIGITLQ